MAGRTTSHTLRITADQQAAINTSKTVKRALTESFPTKVLKEFVAETHKVRVELQAMAKSQQAMVTQNIAGINNLINAVQRLGQAQKAVGLPGGAAAPPSGGGPIPPGQIPGIPPGGGGGPMPTKNVNILPLGVGGAGGANQAQAAGVATAKVFRRTFMAGFLQGLGVAEYMPNDPGMRSRALGIMVGRGLHRAGTVATSPFFNPGMSGLSQGLAGIPIVGGMAAGALNALSGMYGRAAGYESSVQQNMFLYGGNPLAQSRALRTAAAQAASISSARIGKAGEILSAVESGAFKKQISAGLVVPKDGSYFGLNNRPKQIVDIKGDIEKSSIEVARKNFDTILGETNAVRKLAMAEIIGNAMGKSPAATRPGFGVPYGISPEAMQGFLGQYYGARGGDYTEKGTTRRAREGLIAQTLFGVGPQLSGGFGRSDLTGSRADKTGMLNILTSAMLQGFKGTQIQDYLQELVNQGRTAEQQGIKIDQGDMARQTAYMTQQMGLNPVQSLRMAGGLRGVSQQISAQGIQSPEDYMILRAAGFSPRGGRKSYLKAIRALEGGLDAQGMMNLFGMITSGAGAIKGADDEETQLLQLNAVRRVLSAKNIPIGSGIAEKIIQNFSTTIKGPPTASAMQAMEALQSGDLTGVLDVAARGKVGAHAPLTIQQASMGAEQIGLGKKMADTFYNINKIGNKMADTMTNFHTELNAIVGAMGQFAKVLNDLTKGNMVRNIRKLLLGI